MRSDMSCTQYWVLQELIIQLVGFLGLLFSSFNHFHSSDFPLEMESEGEMKFSLVHLVL